MKYPKILIFCLALAVSLPLALLQTRRLGNSHIDIGLDLTDEPANPPRLEFRESGATTTTFCEMQKISDKYTPRHSFFSLTATGEATTQSQGTEVWLLNFPFIKEVVQNPPGSWVQQGTSLVSAGPQPATLRWEGYTRPLKIRLWCHPYSGIAKVTTQKGEQTLNLYAPEGKIHLNDQDSYFNEKYVPLDSVETMVRYQGNFPRKALAGLTINFGHLAPSTRIAKVFIGSLRPRIFTQSANRSAIDWGIVTRKYNPDLANGMIAFNSISPIEQGGSLSFFALFFADLLAISLAGLLALAGFRICRWIYCQPAPARTLKPLSPWLYLLFFLPFLGVWLVFFFSFYPAIMSPDSIGYWTQAHKHIFSDFHPAMLTLGIRFVCTFWDSPAPIALIQLFILAIVQAYAFLLLYRAGVPLWVVVIGMLSVCLSPKNANMSVTLWKDVLCAANVLLVTVLLARYFVDRKAHGKVSYWLFLGLALGYLPFTRHNALLIMFMVSAALLIVCWPARKRVWIATRSTVCLFLFMRHILYPACGVIPINYKNDFAPLKFTADISNFVYYGVPFSEDEYKFLNQVRPFGDRWAYNPIAGSWSISSPPPFNFNLDFATTHLDEYRAIYSSLIHRYPLMYMRYFMIKANYLYNPVQSGVNDIECGYQEIVENLCGLKMMPIFPKLHDHLRNLLTTTSSKSWIWLFWRPAIPLYLVLFACFVLIRRMRDFRYLIIFMPVFLNTASVLAAFSQCQRYQYPLTFAAAFLVCFAFLPKPKPTPIQTEGEQS